MNIQWECAWNQEFKTNPDLSLFLDTLEIVDPVQPRNAFFNGCTNAIKLHHMTDISQGEKIKYVEVTSLYPYPVGHPKVLVNPEDQDINHYFRMVKVDILPPYGLYHPVLPYRHKANSRSHSVNRAWKRR